MLNTLKQKWPLVAGSSVLVAGVAVAIIVTAGDNPPTPIGPSEGDDQTTSAPVVDQQPPAQERPGEDTANPANPQPPTDPITTAPDQPEPTDTNHQPTTRLADSRLPDDWDQLSEPQKLALNPFNCPPDVGGNIRINVATGECLANDHHSNEDPPDQPPSEQLAQTTSINLNQSFALDIRQLELEVVAENFSCNLLSALVSQQTPDLTAEAVQAAFDEYQTGLYTLPQDRRWELIGISGALDYMVNLKQYLGQEGSESISTADIWQNLTEYKECIVRLTAKNVGPDSKFSNGCGLSLDDYVTARSNDRSYQPQYLGQGWACTQAEVPFLTGDSTQLQVIFSLPAKTEITALVIEDDQSEDEAVVINLGKPSSTN